MFQYFEIPVEIQERQSCYFFENYLKCLYNDPEADPPLSNWQPEPTWITERYKDHADRIKSFSVRPDDVWIVSYPKTGTTLTCELVSVLLSGLQCEEAAQVDILQRIHFLELSALSKYTPEDYITRAATDPNRRIIKTHLQMNLMPKEFFSKQPKIIYVARNAKDAAVSLYHHHKNIHGYDRPLTDFLDDFLLGEMPFGSYFRHVEEFSQLVREKKNMLLVKYEQMVEDMPKVVQEVANFLGMSLSEKEVSIVTEYLSFDKMKSRKTSNMQEITEISKKDAGRVESDFQFMRKGKIDSYKDEMPKVYIQRMNEEMIKWKEVNDIYPGN